MFHLRKILKTLLCILGYCQLAIVQLFSICVPLLFCRTILGSEGPIIVFGETDPTIPSANGIVRTISRIVNYPKYYSGTLVDDISMLKLADPIEFTDYVRPACIATSQNETEEYGATDCSIAGWGRTVDVDYVEGKHRQHHCQKQNYTKAA